MFIDANKIIELIEVAKECQEKLPENEQWLHFSDLEATLQKLVDEEKTRLDRMGAEFAANSEEARIEKELEIDMNWPGGI